MKNPEKILICCVRLIGDVIFSTPLLDIFKKQWPDCKIDYLVNEGTGSFLSRDARVRRVITVNNKEFKKNAAGKGRGYLRDIFRKYDIAITLNASDRGHIASILAGRTCRVGFYLPKKSINAKWKRLSLSHPIPLELGDRHVVHRCAEVAEALQLPVSDLRPRVFYSKGDAAAVEKLLSAKKCIKPYFMMHPFARWQYKYWKPDNFAQVSDIVHDQYHMTPVWTSSPDPDEKAQLLEAASYANVKPILLDGVLNLNQVSYLASKADLYIGLDTAVTHIAATWDTPVVALYGPTITRHWHPWRGQNNCPAMSSGFQVYAKTAIIQKNWWCSPCGLAGCDDTGKKSPCIQEIRVDEVLRGVQSVLT